MYGGDTLTVLLVYEALYNDMALGVLSFAIVFLLTLNHLNSLFLAVTGLVQIICTFPVVFFLYEWIVGDLKLGILNVLSIYLVLGIGVDDLFVLVDAYKQEAQHVRARRSRVSFIFSLFLDNILFSDQCIPFHSDKISVPRHRQHQHRNAKHGGGGGNGC